MVNEIKNVIAGDRSNDGKRFNSRNCGSNQRDICNNHHKYDANFQVCSTSCKCFNPSFYTITIDGKGKFSRAKQQFFYQQGQFGSGNQPNNWDNQNFNNPNNFNNQLHNCNNQPSNFNGQSYANNQFGNKQ